MSVALRIVVLLLALFTTSCRGSFESWLSLLKKVIGIEHECTLIGTVQGFILNIDPAFAAKVGDATISACWDGVCRTPSVPLSPSSEMVDDGCRGQVCGAHAVPTDGRFAVIDVPDLPIKSVQITLNLIGISGDLLSSQTITVVPKLVYPNGRDCDEGTPQADLVVAADGTLHAR